MSNAGSALMGIGSARGEDRAVSAAEMAVNSPLLEASIEGAMGVLLSIAGGSDLGLFEINEAAQVVSEQAHADANIIFGTVIDDSLGDEVRVTVIAAGFEGGHAQAARSREPVRRPSPRPAQRRLAVRRRTRDVPAQGAGTRRASRCGRGQAELEPALPPRQQPIASVDTAQRPVGRPARPADDDLDVPDFLK